ncbi:MAG: peptide chain release factor N(5)-glutamine methyltransferase [Clostridia bacterium]|nr:peptide chain release factor N(5)-glutamine methyltransferase [Clostridia bacterium]
MGCKNKTSIGGQAVIEGVMMRGKTSEAIAVRAESGEILIESKRLKSKGKASKIPLIRGAIAFFSSLVQGTKALMRSASVFGEEETSKFENWLSKKLKINAMDIATFLGVTLGIVLSLFLFFYLPQVVADLFVGGINNVFLYCLIEGLIRIAIFIAYILLTSLLKDIRRTFMYHGAEHKTISCYEKGAELTVENVRGCTRVHDRCGTTFMFLVMVISILIFALVNAVLVHFGVEFSGVLGKFFRFLVKILTLPIISGVSYEILKLLSKSQSKFLLIFKAPGLLLQKITTREPSDDMIEVAIASFKEVLLMDENPEMPIKTFNVFGTVKTLYEKVLKILEKGGVKEPSDAEWIVARVSGIARSQIKSKATSVTKEQNDLAISYAKKRAEGIPLAYVFGDADFYGYTFKVSDCVLIPRPETEELCMHAIKEIKRNDAVLDMCTGSGAIAVTVQLKTGAIVSAVDISDNALSIANENAKNLGANVNFINSDLFTSVDGKYDFILSNPPYIKSSDMKDLQLEVAKEPSLALDGGEDGLDFYKKLASDSYKHLNDGGIIYLECGINQAGEIARLFEQVGKYGDIQIIKDVNGIERIIRVVLK